VPRGEHLDGVEHQAVEGLVVAADFGVNTGHLDHFGAAYGNFAGNCALVHNVIRSAFPDLLQPAFVDVLQQGC
jgi:hypothetical protein